MDIPDLSARWYSRIVSRRTRATVAVVLIGTGVSLVASHESRASIGDVGSVPSAVHARSADVSAATRSAGDRLAGSSSRSGSRTGGAPLLTAPFLTAPFLGAPNARPRPTLAAPDLASGAGDRASGPADHAAGVVHRPASVRRAAKRGGAGRRTGTAARSGSDRQTGSDPGYGRRAGSTSGSGTGSPAGGSTCRASYYDQGRRTANGERFYPDGLTAAHRSLPFGTRLRVTNAANGRTVVVRINDRGPFVGGRCLDLSRGAFAAISGLGAGTATVRWEVL